MAQRYGNQKSGSGWGGLLGLPVILGAAWFGYSDANPLNAPAMDPEERARIEGSVYYAGCRQAQRAGATPLHAGEPGYRDTMDGDGDGIACEDY